MIAETIRKAFHEWFAATPLGDLESVREFVAMQALDNAADCDDVLDAAKATVSYYTNMSAAEKAEAFGTHNN